MCIRDSINAVADAYRADGYTVRAVSVANSAVEVLRTDTDVPARSVAAELWQWSQDRERLGPRDLLIIDEASTLGTAWARDLLAEARTRGAVVVLLGDHRPVSYTHLDVYKRQVGLQSGFDGARGEHLPSPAQSLVDIRSV